MHSIVYSEMIWKNEDKILQQMGEVMLTLNGSSSELLRYIYS